MRKLLVHTGRLGICKLLLVLSQIYLLAVNKLASILFLLHFFIAYFFKYDYWRGETCSSWRKSSSADKCFTATITNKNTTAQNIVIVVSNLNYKLYFLTAHVVLSFSLHMDELVRSVKVGPFAFLVVEVPPGIVYLVDVWGCLCLYSVTLFDLLPLMCPRLLLSLALVVVRQWLVLSLWFVRYTG